MGGKNLMTNREAVLHLAGMLFSDRFGENLGICDET